jgi:transcription elongation factor GreB
MNKAFTKEDDGQDDEGPENKPDVLPANLKNYMTPAGFAALQAEHKKLSREERPKVVEVVSWAAGNGDRSENGDYIYGKKRLREIDRRLRYISKRLQTAELVDPIKQQGLEQVFFGATVTYAGADDKEQRVTLVGVDEADITQGKISWIAPLARALMKARAGDTVELRSPSGTESIDIISVEYQL